MKLGLDHQPSARSGRLVTSGRDGEAGAVLILVAVCMSVLVTATAFTVDLGRLSLARRDLQVIADSTALDLSRRLDGRSASEITADPAWAAALDASLTRNGFDQVAPRSVDVAIGAYDQRTEVFTPAVGPQVPVAVRVRVADEVDFKFVPGSADVSRTGIASQSAVSGFGIGSYAARLDSSNSALLGALLGDSLGITAAGYEGLVGGRVGLDALALELGLDLGNPAELLSTELPLGDLLLAEAEVLRLGGDVARAGLLEALALDLPDPTAPITLGDLMTIATGGEAAAAEATLDALDLLAAAAFVANGTNFLDIPAIGLNVGGQLVDATGRLQLIEAPMWAFGPVGTTASTAQARLELSVPITVPGVSETTLELTLDVASATATSTAMSCGSVETLDLAVQTGLVISQTDVTSQLAVAGIPVADVELSASTSAPGTVTSIAFTMPPDVYGGMYPVSTTPIDIGSAAFTTDAVTIIGVPIGVVVGPLVTTLVNTVLLPTIDQLEALVLNPLADALGLMVASADASPLAVTCSGPRLVG